MANRDLLKEAIADAKAVKEVAIANAKAALEEAFTPHLKDMLAQKINEMDELEETDLAEVDKEKKMKEEMEVKKEGYGKQDEAKEEVKEEELEEELDLEEILAELELEEGEELEEADETNEGEEVKEGEDYMEEAKDEEVKEGDDYMEEADVTYEAEEGEEAEEEIDLEDMSEEDLKGFIEDVIEDMIEDGELVPGPNADESEAEEGEDTDDGMTGDADVDIEVDDIDLQEGKEEVNESALLTALGGIVGTSSAALLIQYLENYAKQNPDSPIAQIMGKIQNVAAGSSAATGMTAGKTAELEEGILDFLKKKKKEAPKPKKPEEKVLGVDFDGNYIYGEGQEKLKEAKEVIQTLRSDLNEVNLLNSKLLYTNKIFKAKNLTENQKIKVLKAFDKAETVKEAKAIYETLNENLVAKTKKSHIRESLGAASKPAGVAPKTSSNSIVEEDAMVSRFKKLAGIN